MIPWSSALPQPEPEQQEPPAPPAAPPTTAATDDAAPEDAAPEDAPQEATDGSIATGELETNEQTATGDVPAQAAAMVPKPATVRRSRWERYRPRPAITLLAFTAGIVIGGGMFVSRLQPPPVAEGLPPSPYMSLDGSQAAPFPVIMIMEGLTSNAAAMPTVVQDRALGQLKRVVDQFTVITRIEHQGTVVVADQALSALIVHGIDHQGRAAASTLTAYLVNGQIVEFR